MAIIDYRHHCDCDSSFLWFQFVLNDEDSVYDETIVYPWRTTTNRTGGMDWLRHIMSVRHHPLFSLMSLTQIQIQAQQHNHHTHRHTYTNAHIHPHIYACVTRSFATLLILLNTSSNCHNKIFKFRVGLRFDDNMIIGRFNVCEQYDRIETHHITAGLGKYHSEISWDKRWGQSRGPLVVIKEDLTHIEVDAWLWHVSCKWVPVLLTYTVQGVTSTRLLLLLLFSPLLELGRFVRRTIGVGEVGSNGVQHTWYCMVAESTWPWHHNNVSTTQAGNHNKHTTQKRP